MYPEDYLMFMTFHSEPRCNSNPISGRAPSENAPLFPAELLDSGFELTEILTAESKNLVSPEWRVPMERHPWI